MQFRRVVVASLLFTALATPAPAQDFLGALGRRAAEAAAGRLVGRQTESPDAARSAPTTDRGRGRNEAPDDSSRDRAALDRLSEEEREAECDRRVPQDRTGGRSYEEQVLFRQCMGPRWGDGG